MNPSTVPDAKAALLAALRARPALDGVQVAWSHPGQTIKSECIFFGDVEPDQDASRLGNQRRRERYDLELLVSVFDRNAKDHETVERRCWTLLAEVFTQLREDDTLGGTVDVAQIAASPVRNFNGSNGRISEAECRIAVQAEV